MTFLTYSAFSLMHAAVIWAVIQGFPWGPIHVETTLSVHVNSKSLYMIYFTNNIIIAIFYFLFGQ